MSDIEDRYFAEPTGVPGYFVLWDRRSDSAVYGIEVATQDVVDACAKRLNTFYRQFVKDRNRDKAAWQTSRPGSR